MMNAGDVNDGDTVMDYMEQVFRNSLQIKKREQKSQTLRMFFIFALRKEIEALQ